MKNLFKKAAIFTDIHFGAKNNSDIHNNDCIDFITWAIQTAKNNNCETCMFLGDYHNNRATMNMRTMQFALRGLELLSQNFTQTFFIPGNHDLFYRDKREVFSTPWAKHLPNILTINDWFEDGDTVICPWLIENDHEKLLKKKGKYCFGHFELPGYLMNALVRMPDIGKATDADFQNFEAVFSGHFHKRQSANNVTYIGNAFPHNYSDNGDDERGMMILEWGQKPVYHTWDKQPTYRVFNLSEILDDSTIIKPKMHLRLIEDVSLNFEEYAVIKQSLIESYSLRDLTIVPSKKEITESTTEIAPFEGIDSIVQNQINEITSDHYDKDMLLNIYRNC